MQILDLAELDDVHRPSMQRARGAPSTALFMATAIYDKALSDSDRPMMAGPEDQAEDEQVKAYRGLTAACESTTYDALCILGPSLLRSATVTIYGPAPAAAALAPPADGVMTLAMAKSLGTALEPVLGKMASALEAGQASMGESLKPMTEHARERALENEAMASGRASGQTPAAGAKGSKNLTSAVLDNA
jgi:hypothetical protein